MSRGVGINISHHGIRRAYKFQRSYPISIGAGGSRRIKCLIVNIKHTCRNLDRLQLTVMKSKGLYTLAGRRQYYAESSRTVKGVCRNVRNSTGGKIHPEQILTSHKCFLCQTLYSLKQF